MVENPLETKAMMQILPKLAVFFNKKRHFFGQFFGENI
jgi:hypothetical protein